MTDNFMNLVSAFQATVWQALAERSVVVGGAGAVCVVLLMQAGILAWTLRRLRELGHIRERLSRLADGLSLLTDTTESGLQTIIRQVEHLSRVDVARPAPRAAVSRRVAAAARRGQPLAQIAERELLSESEVRLHLSMAGTTDTKGDAACLAASTSR